MNLSAEDQARLYRNAKASEGIKTLAAWTRTFGLETEPGVYVWQFIRDERQVSVSLRQSKIPILLELPIDAPDDAVPETVLIDIEQLVVSLDNELVIDERSIPALFTINSAQQWLLFEAEAQARSGA